MSCFYNIYITRLFCSIALVHAHKKSNIFMVLHFTVYFFEQFPWIVPSFFIMILQWLIMTAKYDLPLVCITPLSVSLCLFFLSHWPSLEDRVAGDIYTRVGSCCRAHTDSSCNGHFKVPFSLLAYQLKNRYNKWRSGKKIMYILSDVSLPGIMETSGLIVFG